MTDHAKAPPWTDEEYAYLEDHQHLTSREIADALGRSVGAVEKKRAKIKRGWEPARDQWTDEDIDFVRTHVEMTAPQVAAAIGRTVAQVQNQRKRLNKEGISFRVGHRKKPTDIGARRLLAKTCPSCGFFLPASWFYFAKTNGGYYTPRCSKCLSDADGRPGRGGSDNGQSRRKMQAKSLETATRMREPWTGPDHEVLASPDLTLLDKAIRLGRTYYAVMHQTDEHSYRSKVGLGEREQSAWVIAFAEGAA